MLDEQHVLTQLFSVIAFHLFKGVFGGSVTYIKGFTGMETGDWGTAGLHGKNYCTNKRIDGLIMRVMNDSSPVQRTYRLTYERDELKYEECRRIPMYLPPYLPTLVNACLVITWVPRR